MGWFEGKWHDSIGLDLRQKIIGTKDKAGELKETLLDIEIIVKDFKKNAPYSDSNKKKGISIIKGTFGKRTRKRLRDLEAQASSLKEDLRAWITEVGKGTYKQIDELHNMILKNKTTEMQYDTIMAKILTYLAYNREGTFYSALTDGKYEELTEEKVAECETIVTSALAIVNPVVKKIDLIRDQAKSVGIHALEPTRL